MKKIITMVALSLIALSGTFAQIAFGVRGSLGISILSITEAEERDLGNSLASGLSEGLAEGLGLASLPSATYSVENDNVLTGGFALFGNYSIPSLPALGVQAELGFLFNNGTEITAEAKSTVVGVGRATLEATDKISYTTMELPLLVTYTVNKGGFFEFIPQAGFYFSIPIGKCKEELDIKGNVAGETFDESETEKTKIDSTAIFGTAFGADFAFNFSKTSALMLNLRYMFDFNKLKVDGEEVARRSVFLMSAGYRYTIR